MGQQDERRRFPRFEVPEGKARWKETDLSVAVQGFSASHRVMNLSEGGLAFVCEEELSEGQDLLVQLQGPNKMRVDLLAQVRWRERPPGASDTLVGVEFKPFGKGKDSNSLEALGILTELEACYGEGEAPEK